MRWGDVPYSGDTSPFEVRRRAASLAPSPGADGTSDLYTVPGKRACPAVTSKFMDLPVVINPQSNYLHLPVPAAKKLDGVSDVRDLLVMRRCVPDAIVMAGDGDSSGIVPVDRRSQSRKNRLDQGGIALLRQDQTGAGLGYGVHAFDIEPLLKEVDHRQLHSPVHAIDNPTECHGVQAPWRRPASSRGWTRSIRWLGALP